MLEGPGGAACGSSRQPRHPGTGPGVRRLSAAQAPRFGAPLRRTLRGSGADSGAGAGVWLAIAAHTPESCWSPRRRRRGSAGTAASVPRLGGDCGLGAAAPPASAAWAPRFGADRGLGAAVRPAIGAWGREGHLPRSRSQASSPAPGPNSVRHLPGYTDPEVHPPASGAAERSLSSATHLLPGSSLVSQHDLRTRGLKSPGGQRNVMPIGGSRTAQNEHQTRSTPVC